MKRTADSSSRSRWFISGTIFNLALIALIIQVTTADVTTPPTRTPQDDQIQLQIIENEIQQLAKIILQDKENQIGDAENLIPYPPNRGFELHGLAMIENLLDKLVKPLLRLNEQYQLNSDDTSNSRVVVLLMTIDEMQVTLHRLKDYLISGDIADSNFSSNILPFLEKEEGVSMLLDNILLDGIVSALQHRQFSMAEEQLQLVTNGAIYDKTVQAVCNHTADNTDLIQTFGDSISNVNTKLKLFAALFDQMKTNGHLDVRKLITLGQSLKALLIHPTNGAALLLFNILSNSIQTAAKKPIVDSFQNHHSWNITTFLSSALVKDFAPVARNIYQHVIDSLGIEKTLLGVENINDLRSEMYVYQVILDELENKGLLNTNLSISFARALKESTDSALLLDLQPRYENMKNKLPKSVRNLVFSPKICIKNSLYGEYLFGDEESIGYGHDYQRRSVYTWIPKNDTRSSIFKWTVDFESDNQVEIHNVATGDQLFACYYIHFDNERRMVFTYRQRLSLSGDITKWKFEVDGEGLGIINVGANEYMYADGDKKQDDRKRYVFTHMSQLKTKDSKWEIIDCSD